MIAPTVKIFPYIKKGTPSLAEADFFWRLLIKGGTGQELHIILSVDCRNQEETILLSKELWSLATGYLSEASLGEGEGRILNPESICEGILKSFNDYMSVWAEKAGLDDWNNLSIFFGVMDPAAFYFAKVGESGAVLFRNRNLINIDENLKTPRSPEFSPPFPEIAGGKIQMGDRIIIGSAGFFRSISQGEIPSLIDSQTFEVATRNLERVSESVNNVASIGFLMGEVSLKSESDKYFFSKPEAVGFSSSQVGSLSFLEFNSLQDRSNINREKKDNFLPVKETVGAIKEKITGPIFSAPLKIFNSIILGLKNVSSTRRIILGAVFIILMFLAGYWNYSFSKKNQEVSRTNKLFEDKNYDYDKIFAAVEKLEDESESALIYKDEEKAKKSLFEATEMLSKITGSGDYGIRALKIKKEIEDKMNSMEKNDIFVNSELVWSPPSSESVADFTLDNGNNILTLTGGDIYRLSLKNVEDREKIASGENFKVASSFLLRAKLETLLLSGESKDFWSIDPSKNQLSAKKTVKEDSFVRSQPAKAFENYIYFWNQEEKQFKQYTFQNGEIIFYKNWLKENPVYFEEDGSPVDFTVDGNIFAVSSKGKIWKLSGGKKIDWNFESPVRPLSSEKLKIETADDFTNLYVLDPSKQRIAIFEKETGKLKGQIKNADLAEAINFRVDESKKEIYFNKPKEIRKIVFELPKEG